MPYDPAAETSEERKSVSSAKAGGTWRGRAKRSPMPLDEATRQGTIANLAFLTLGKEGAITFLNTYNARLGGRPLSIATNSSGGAALVALEIDSLRVAQAGLYSSVTEELP